MNVGTDPDDATLLRRYVEEGSEASFAEIVSRHLGLVYAAALRQLGGDAHRAEDITQAVFIELARQARKVCRHTALAGWLYTTTHHLVCHQLRGDQRRAHREREAQVAQELNQGPPPDWRELRSLLDDAMQELRETDRLAVLLRFFEGQNLRAVASALGVSEDAARMRVERALDRLRMGLLRRGIDTTAAALVPALGAVAAEAVPAGLAGQIVSGALATATVTATAAAGGLSGSAGTLATVQAQIALMKIPLLTTSLAAVLIVVPLARQQQELTASRAELALLKGLMNGANTGGLDSNLPVNAFATEMATLRGEAAELARLRAEKTSLMAAVNSPLHADLARAEQARSAARAALDEARARVGFVVTREKIVTTLKQLGLAARIHASDHQDQLPRTFEEFAKALADQFPEVDQAGVEQYEFYPQPRVIQETDLGLFLFREKQPRRRLDGTWERAYTMVDGSVQTLGSSSPDFTEAEKNANGIATP